MQRNDQLETLRLGRGVLRFSVPHFTQVIIVTLTFFAIMISWRAAAYLAQATHYAFTGNLLLPEGYRRVDAWGSLLISVRCICIESAFLAGVGLIAHFSKRIHLRINARGLAIASSAIILWQLGAALLVYWAKVRNIPSIAPFFGSIIVGIAGFSLLAAGAKRFALARRHMALGADEVLRIDPRRAILYLRSFSQDDLTAPGSPANPETTFSLPDRIFLPGFWLHRRHLTFEEILCKALSTVAPVVAIGKPGEPLPRLGAARKYITDELWQSEVMRLLEVTRFTCLVVGVSEGLRWEFGQVMHQEDPTKILLIIPHNDSSPHLWQSFSRNADESVLPSSIPDETLALLFRRDWRPLVVTGRATVGNYRKIAQLMILNSTISK